MHEICTEKKPKKTKNHQNNPCLVEKLLKTQSSFTGKSIFNMGKILRNEN